MCLRPDNVRTASMGAVSICHPSRLAASCNRHEKNVEMHERPVYKHESLLGLVRLWPLHLFAEVYDDILMTGIVELMPNAYDNTS